MLKGTIVVSWNWANRRVDVRWDKNLKLIQIGPIAFMHMKLAFVEFQRAMAYMITVENVEGNLN